MAKHIYNDIIHYIETNIKTSIDFDMMSKQLNYSVRHLRRVFKTHSNTTLVQYITQRKLIHILYEHKTSIQSLKILCEAYGYATYDTFLRAFKRMFGTSPSKFSGHHDMAILNIIDQITAPVMLNKSYRKYDVNFKHNFKDVYWSKDSFGITSFYIDIKGKQYDYKALKKLEFGDQYILKINDLSELTDLNQTVFAFLNNPLCKKSERHIVLLNMDKYPKVFVYKLSRALKKQNAILIPMDTRLMMDKSLRIEAMFSLIDFINSKHHLGLDFEDLKHMLETMDYKSIYYLESAESLEICLDKLKNIDIAYDKVLYMIQTKRPIHLEALSTIKMSKQSRLGFLVDESLDKAVKILAIYV